jgi:hypothetical protein
VQRHAPATEPTATHDARTCTISLSLSALCLTVLVVQSRFFSSLHNTPLCTYSRCALKRTHLSAPTQPQLLPHEHVHPQSCKKGEENAGGIDSPMGNNSLDTTDRNRQKENRLTLADKRFLIPHQTVAAKLTIQNQHHVGRFGARMMTPSAPSHRRFLFKIILFGNQLAFM